MSASATIAPASTLASTRTRVRNASVSLSVSISPCAVAVVPTAAVAAVIASASASAMSPTRTTAPAHSHSHSHSHSISQHQHQQVYNVNGYNLAQHQQATRFPFSQHHHNHTPPQPSSSASATHTNQSQFLQQQEEGNINPAASSTYAHNRPSPSSYSSAPTITTQNNLNAPTRPKMSRNNSHLRRSGPGALVIPIPPTLANSPHLQSPNSIFRRPHPGPRASPGVEEERWLRDTVPIDGASGSGSETFVVPLSAGPVYATNASGQQQGRARSNSVVSPPGYDSMRANTAPQSSPAFSLLPSSLPTPTRQAAYTKTHTPRASG